MNYKQPNLLAKPQSADITYYGKNGNLNLVNSSDIHIDSNNSTASQLLLRVQEVEGINTELEKLVEERTEQLADVIATNAKFLSILAHDLRSPFQTIIGALDLLHESFSDYDAKEIDSYIHMATNSANTTLRLLENLLSWTSSQNKEKNFNPAKVNLFEAISLEIESINGAATQKQIKIFNLVSPDLFINADLQMVTTILRNLINNAIKYSYLGGKITIVAKEKKPFVEIDIEDNGIGISQTAQKEIFKRNEFHSTRGTRNESGTGLGLLLCKEFVEMHGGTIWIESEPGKGSNIKFTLPHYI